MKLTIILLAALLLACTATESVTGMETLKDEDAETNTITYVIMGDAYSVDIAFCSDLGPRDTVPGVILPFYASFEIPVGEQVFMRVHKRNLDDVITLGIAQNNFFNVVDNAIQGDGLAEAECAVVRRF